jgi:regulator of replication initiation timing
MQPMDMNAMDSELSGLEERLGRLAALVRRLRDENTALIAQQHAAQAENAALRAKVDSASLRLQRLLERLPEEAA